MLRVCQTAVTHEPFLVSTFLHSVVSKHLYTISHHDIAIIFTLIHKLFTDTSNVPTQINQASAIFQLAFDSLAILVRNRQDNVLSLFYHFTQCLSASFTLLRTVDNSAKVSILPIWLQAPSSLDLSSAKLVTRLLIALTAKSFSQGKKMTSYQGALSKHAPFVLARYLLACTANPPLSGNVRAALWPGIKAIMGSMSKFEREALMKGMLTSEHEAERVLLRALWKDFDRQRYKGA
jgi:hypothetical protein